MAKKMNNNTFEFKGISYTLTNRVRDKSEVRDVVYSIESYVKAVDEGKICRDPLIQRTDDQWSRKQRSKFIEAILRDRPIGSITTAKGRAESRNYRITSLIDGLQRTTAIVDYVHDRFALDKKAQPILCKFEDSEGNEIEEYLEISGKRFSQLPDAIKDFFNSYTIITYLYENFSDDELDDIVYCMNNGKTPTSYQKIRFLLGSENMRYLHPICDSTLWEDNRNCKAKNDSILCCVIRTLMMLSNYNYTNLGSAQMTRFVESDYSDYVKISTVKELNDLVEQLAEIKYQMTDEEVTRLDACSIPHLILNLKKFNAMENLEGITYIDFLRKFWNSEDFASYTEYCETKGSGASQYSIESIDARQYIIDDFLDEIFDKTDKTNKDGVNEYESNKKSITEEARAERNCETDNYFKVNTGKTDFNDKSMQTDGRDCGEASDFRQKQKEIGNNIPRHQSEPESA